jgi:diguanylate cyclase (GGDEF)-like protein/PAS domain S-box-containing protein
MLWQYTPLIIPLLLSSAISSFLAFLVWRRRTAPGATPLAWILVVAALWCTGYTIELSAASLPEKLSWSNLNFSLMIFIPITWLIFVLEYTGNRKLLNKRNIFLLCIVPLLTIFLVWTSNWHQLIFQGHALVTTPLYTALERTKSAGYWLHIAYYYGLALAGFVLFMGDLSSLPRTYWGQKITLVAGAAFPWVANALTVTGLSPFPALDLTPFALTIFGLTIFWSLYGFRLFDLIPIARTAVIESMNDGVIVIDEHHRIADLNKAATAILGVAIPELIGKSIQEMPPPWPDLLQSERLPRDRREELVIGNHASHNYYDLRISTLYSLGGDYAGQLIVLRDVNESKHAEESLRARESFLTQLNDITRTALEAADFKQIVEALTHRLAKLIQADGCIISLWDETSNRLASDLEESLVRDPSPARALEPGELALRRSVDHAGHSLVVEDVFQSPYIDPMAAAKCQNRSLLGIPLISNNQKLGVVLFTFHHVHYFTPDEVSLCEQAVDQVALAIARGQALEEARRRAREADTLYRASAALTTALDLHQTLETILVQLERVIPYDSASIFLKVGNQLRAEAVRGLPNPERILGQIFPDGDLLLQEISRTDSPVILDDAQVDRRFNRWGNTNYVRGWMGVALVGHGVMSGYLTLDSRAPGAFNAEHARLVKGFASQAAMAIENARLYMSEQQRLNELNALHNATTALLSTLDLDKLLNRILAAALSAIPGAEMGTLALVEPLSGELEVRSTMGYSHEHSLNFTFLRSETYAIRALKERQPVLLNSIEESESSESSESLPGLRTVRSAIVVPLIMEDQTMGVISLDATRAYAFNEEDLRLLVSFAATATAAIHNAQHHADVQQLAITDALTGLYNLRGLGELGRREVERSRRFSRPLAGVMLDIDYFKNVNDQWGHATGNQVLVCLAQICQVNIRDIDIVARYGGEEFAILLPETDLDTAEQIAERLRSAVESTRFHTDSGELYITISLGVASLTEDTQGLSELLNCADAALYAAKQGGRNRVVVG